MAAWWLLMVATQATGSTSTDEGLSPRLDGDPHSWKVEVYNHTPSLGITDLKPRQFEAWSAIVSCTADPKRSRVDHCRLHNDRVHWAYALRDDPSVVAYSLELPVAIEVIWTPRGRIQTVHLSGDREAFYLEISEAFSDLRSGSTARNVKGTTGEQRQLGQYAERELMEGVIGALEVELPKKGLVEDKVWSCSDSPRAARRYHSSTSSTSMKCRVTDRQDPRAFIACAGRFSEIPSDASASAAGMYVETKIKRNVWFSLASGRIESGELHTWTGSTASLFGFTARSIYVQPFHEGMAGTPKQRVLPPDNVMPPQ